MIDNQCFNASVNAPSKIEKKFHFRKLFGAFFDDLNQF